MNQTKLDLGADKNGSKIAGKRILDFTKELELFVVLVLMGIFFITAFAAFTDAKAFQITNLFFLLVISLSSLIFYVAATTRTVNATFSYKIKQVIKRVFDIVLAFILLNLFSPMFLLLSIAIRAESAGPAFFYTIRAGQFGRPFRMLKFRTMFVAPKGEYTRIGNFLRKSGMSELPQLWNVLIGEMSFVGPSPRRLENLEETLDSESKILTVVPGITGMSQILGVTGKAAINLDLKYVCDWSLALDIDLLVRTMLLGIRGLIQKS